jgi:histone acetyltransferase (RNA polymerase elongator complex component)
VDNLTEEKLLLLKETGCTSLSFGVESGSQRILDAIDKKITKQEIIEAADMAKRYGVHVRFYMMLGNRAAPSATLDFLRARAPPVHLLLPVGVSSTRFHDAEAAG